MSLPFKVKVQEDSIASIKTRGLIGEKYVEITPGASEEILGAGNRIRETQPPVDFEQVISNFVFGKI
jgi:phospholipid/cholesterol/gamma-HCH transport system substrate-binding protein